MGPRLPGREAYPCLLKNIHELFRMFSNVRFFFLKWVEHISLGLLFCNATQQKNPSTFNCTPRIKNIPKPFFILKGDGEKRPTFQKQTMVSIKCPKSVRNIYCPIGTFHNETNFRLSGNESTSPVSTNHKKNRWLKSIHPFKAPLKVFQNHHPKKGTFIARAKLLGPPQILKVVLSPFSF